MDKQFLKKSIERQALILEKKVFRPKVDVIDYGGMLCYTAKIVMEDGKSLCATSFEVTHPCGESASPEEVFALLQSRCEEVVQEGTLPDSSYLDSRLTEQYLACLTD